MFSKVENSQHTLSRRGFSIQLVHMPCKLTAWYLLWSMFLVPARNGTIQANCQRMERMMTLNKIKPSKTQYIPHLKYWQKRLTINLGTVAPSSNLDYLYIPSSFLYLCLPEKNHCSSSKDFETIPVWYSILLASFFTGQFFFHGLIY